jgi:hypothetical protein
MIKKTTTIFFIVFLFYQSQIVTAQMAHITVTRFRDSGTCSAWCPYNDTLVAYNLLQPNGYYNISLADVTPGNTLVHERCFTCGNSHLPGKNVAQPNFSPNGKYILFMAEQAVHPGNSVNSIPGIGRYNDLWVMTADGTKTYRLTTTLDTNVNAMIEPYFNPAGNEIMWDIMTDTASGVLKQIFGYWVIKIAPFIDDPVLGPYIDSTHIRTIQPGGINALNEPYGWSPDGSKILFASCYNQVTGLEDQIYSMDTDGTNIQQLSSTAHGYKYCEHGFYNTTGTQIVYMTDRDADAGASVGGDDWWIMNSDSTDDYRLTYFNDTASSYWTGNVHINLHGSFCHDSNKFIGDVSGSTPVQQNVDSSIGALYIINLNYLTGIEPISENALNCTVYPNPASNFITVAVNTTNTGNLNYSIYTLLGRKVTESVSNGKTCAIAVSNLSDGVYFLKISNQYSTIDKKIVIERK